MVKPIDFKSVSGGKTKDAKEQESEIAKMVDSLPNIIKMMEVKAKISKSYYNDLVGEGFTKKEALEIVKSDTTMG